ncbi:MAG: hypothetical protein LBQ96_00250 [Fusobacteriaceae bacterium]|nr:hypothetical protein [Fusobacteriaceae bacterium]
MDYNLKKASEKALKTFLKKKQQGYTLSLLVTFLITGAISLFAGWTAPPAAEPDPAVVDETPAPSDDPSQDVASMEKELRAKLVDNEQKLIALRRKENLLLHEADWYSKPVWLTTTGGLLASWKSSDSAPDRWVRPNRRNTDMDLDRERYEAAAALRGSGGGYPIPSQAPNRLNPALTTSGFPRAG